MGLPRSDMAQVDGEEMTEDIIRFSAQVSKVSTLADGGIRITLDLPETAIDTATKLMQVRQAGALLEVAAVPVNKAKNGRKSRKTEITDGISATY